MVGSKITLDVALQVKSGGGPRVVVSTAAFHARVRGSVPGLGGLKETKMFLPHPCVKVSIAVSLRDLEVACSASDRQGSNFESCVWRTVSSQSSHHPQEVLLAQFSLYVHKGGIKPDSFHLQVKSNMADICPSSNNINWYHFGYGRRRFMILVSPIEFAGMPDPVHVRKWDVTIATVRFFKCNLSLLV